MSQSRSFLSLDVGEKRIGVAVGDSGVRIAVPFETIEVDGNEVERIARLVVDQQADTIVVGYPRNQSGETTAQTEYVEAFAAGLQDIAPHLVFQEQSLTSVLEAPRPKAQRESYTNGDTDA